jgi:hypothetical protein
VSQHEAMTETPWDSSDVTLESIRDLLAKMRKRTIVLFHEDDREIVEEVCRRMRDEGFEVAEKAHLFSIRGKVICFDADMLQPPKFPMWDIVIFDPNADDDA